MMEHRLMTFEEKGILLDAVYEADQIGNKEEAYRLLAKLPLAPGLAKIAKEMYGREHLLNGEYNLAEAYREFGNDWLDQ